jgi:hypothetical protein
VGEPSLQVAQVWGGGAASIGETVPVLGETAALDVEVLGVTTAAVCGGAASPEGAIAMVMAMAVE